MGEFLTTKQVAKKLQVSVNTVKNWLSTEGKLKGYKAGKNWRIKSEDLEKFIAGHSEVTVFEGEDRVKQLLIYLLEEHNKPIPEPETLDFFVELLSNLLEKNGKMELDLDMLFNLQNKK